MKLVLLVGAALLLGVLLGLDHVRSRFEHTARSRRVLAAESLASYVIGVVLAVRLVPWAVHWAALLGIVLALPVFTLMAVVTVEAWRLSHQQEYDAEIARLERQQIDIIERRDDLQRQMAELKRQQSRRDVRSDAGLFRRRQLKRQVETWAHEGGFARIRSLRVEDWTRQLEGRGAKDLRDRIDILERQLEDAGPKGDRERSDQLQAQRALIELHYLDRFEDESKGSDPDRLEQRIAELGGTVEECGTRLAEIEAEIEDWRRRRSFFQSQKLRLD